MLLRGRRRGHAIASSAAFPAKLFAFAFASAFDVVYSIANLNYRTLLYFSFHALTGKRVYKNQCWGNVKSVITMSSSEKVLHIALVGHPVLEVAAIVTCDGRVIDTFHEFVNYFNGVYEGFRREQEPVTDSFGTRFEHAIGEHHLDQCGLSLAEVQENLRRFVTTHIDNVKVIVNDLSQYHSMNLNLDANHVWNPRNTFSRIVKKIFFKEMPMENILQGKRRCNGHRSAYYRLCTREPDCALKIAAVMVQDSN
ncbi:MAG: hypothetical protein AAGJ80_16655 [Cyanobacteria bacterium J06553_1]